MCFYKLFYIYLQICDTNMRYITYMNDDAIRDTLVLLSMQITRGDRTSVMVTFAEKFKWMYNLKNHPSITLAVQSHILEFSIIYNSSSYLDGISSQNWTADLHLDHVYFSAYETCISLPFISSGWNICPDVHLGQEELQGKMHPCQLKF